MRRVSLLVALLVAVSAGGYPPVPQTKPKTEDPAGQLEGEWVVSKSRLFGKEVSLGPGIVMRFSIKGRQMKSRSGPAGGGKETELTYTLDAKKKPMHIDLTVKSPAATLKGICKVEKGQLHLCYTTSLIKGGAGPAADRPKDFGASDAILLILDREKK